MDHVFVPRGHRDRPDVRAGPSRPHGVRRVCAGRCDRRDAVPAPTLGERAVDRRGRRRCVAAGSVGQRRARSRRPGPAPFPRSPAVQQRDSRHQVLLPPQGSASRALGDRNEHVRIQPDASIAVARAARRLLRTLPAGEGGPSRRGAPHSQRPPPPGRRCSRLLRRQERPEPHRDGHGGH